MATKYNFHGKIKTEPGSYAQIFSGVTPGQPENSFSNVLIIDTGSAAGFAGAGVMGEFVNTKRAIYQFEDYKDFKTFVRGSIWYRLAEYLGKPSARSVNGVGRIYFVSAKVSISSTTTLIFSGGVGNGGSIVLKSLFEGIGSNGTLLSGKLTRGFAVQMSASVFELNKFILTFYRGGFTGLDSDGLPYDGISEADSQPIIITQSIEFDNIDQLYNWMTTDEQFGFYFRVTNFTKSGTGAIDGADLIANSALRLFTGGTESYTPQAFDKVLESIGELDVSFIFSDNHGADATGVENTKILNFIKTEALFKKVFVIGGGRTVNQFSSGGGSTDMARYYDDENVVIVHSGIRKLDTLTAKVKDLDSFHTAALVLGRIAGLEPQNPSTFKELDIVSVEHEMTEKERVFALDKGVLHLRFVDGFWVINQGINTVQNNGRLIVNDAKGNISHDITIVRIAAQLNRELIYAIRNPITGLIGKNINNVTPADMKAYIEGFLKRKTATKTTDNLILSFSNVSSKLVNSDSYANEYQFVPNGPINKIFNTGFVLDINL